VFTSPTRARLTLTRFSCARCAYGASSRIAPDRCPMCNGTVWTLEKSDQRRSLNPSPPTDARL
jgi:rubrerythrin